MNHRAIHVRSRGHSGEGNIGSGDRGRDRGVGDAIGAVKGGKGEGESHERKREKIRETGEGGIGKRKILVAVIGCETERSGRR